MDQRQKELKEWVKTTLKDPTLGLSTLAADASFRRYFRVHSQQGNFVTMDAPPDKEPVVPFVTLAQQLAKHNIRVPSIFYQDLEQGFLLLSDFGDATFLRTVHDSNADELYRRALDDLLLLQRTSAPASMALPHFDARMMLTELENFREWFIIRYLNDPLTAKEHQHLTHAFTFLIKNMESQPQIFVHRDYHSRNLMVVDDKQLGVLDFQDAVIGPITYDLASLLRDCYIQWPMENIQTWVQYFYDAKIAAGEVSSTFTQFMNWFDISGIQRHLKASFIFARKWLRDDDPRYLESIPRTIGYIHQMTNAYPELKNLHLLFREKICPLIQENCLS